MEKNKIYLEDNLVTLSKTPDNYYDMVITSPPYDGIRKYNGFAFDIDTLTTELYRTMKNGGVIVWVVNDQVVKGSETGTSFRQALKFMDTGFLLHDTMIYEKNSSSYPASSKSNRYTQIFEYMFVFSKGKPKTTNLICDKPNKWAGHTNWGKNTKRIGDNEQLVDVGNIKPVPDFSPRNNIWRYMLLAVRIIDSLANFSFTSPRTSLSGKGGGGGGFLCGENSARLTLGDPGSIPGFGNGVRMFAPSLTDCDVLTSCSIKANIRSILANPTSKRPFSSLNLASA